MARKVVRLWDEERTSLLACDELFVQKGKGGSNYYTAFLQEQEVEKCPVCGNEAIKLQDLFSKTYLDLISENGKDKVISLNLEFYKYRCQNNACRHIFAKDISFASRYDNVTYRLINKLASYIQSGCSYAQVCTRLSDALTRQAIGQIFNRWVHNKDESRKIKTLPETIAVITGQTGRDFYTVFLNLDDRICVIDILYGIGSGSIAAVLRKIGQNAKTVLTNIDSTVIDTVKTTLPNALHIIPVEYWFKLVTEDFAELAHNIMKWSTVPNKDQIILQAESELGYRTSDRDRLLESRPELRAPYEAFNRLRQIVFNREELWIFDELTDWLKTTPDEFKELLSTTEFQLNIYKNEIQAHAVHRDSVPDYLYYMTERLEELIHEQRTFSEEVLKARVLYATSSDLTDWRGVPIEDVIKKLQVKTDGELQDEYE